MLKKNIKTEPQKRGRPTDPDKDLSILQAATCLFMQNGFHATSMDQIAKTAGISKITLYNRYKDKDALFKSVISQRCNQHTMSDSFIVFEGCDVKVALSTIGLNFLGLIFSEDAIKMHRIIESESVRYPKVAELFYEAGPVRVKSEFRQLLSAWQKLGKVQIDNIDKAIEHWFSLLKGEAHMKMLLNIPCKMTEKQMKEHVESCVKMFLSCYQR